MREIEAVGFAIEKRRVVSDTVSGSLAIEQRPGSMKLMDGLERDHVLIVTQLDRLGRNAMDVAATVAKLADMGARVHCLALGGAAGRMAMQVLNAVAQFERDLLIERIQSGLERARAAGERLERPNALDEDQQAVVRARLQAGISVFELAREYGTSCRATLLMAGQRRDRMASLADRGLGVTRP